jgi:coatomer protein complex subunit alpha (xenin)
MSIELERCQLADNSTSLKRVLELSAYFTIPKLEPAHRQLALVSAMNLAYKNKNFASALSFANRILANGVQTKMLENVSISEALFIGRLTNLNKARKMKAICERSPHDAIDIEFDQFAEFDICAASHTPIYRGSRVETCPYDGAMYHAKCKGTVCTVCGVTEVGAPASGFRLLGA